MEKSIFTRAASDFDGQMPGCTGAECGHCCNGRNITSLIKDEILDHGGVDGLKRMGIEVESVPEFYRGQFLGFMHRLRNCLGDNDCKFPPSKKPFTCKTFPFDMRQNRPLSFGCPKIIEIASDQKTIRTILEIRARLSPKGASSNEEWRYNMQTNIDVLRGIRDRLGLSTEKSDEEAWLRVIKETLIRLQGE